MSLPQKNAFRISKSDAPRFAFELLPGTPLFDVTRLEPAETVINRVGPSIRCEDLQTTSQSPLKLNLKRVVVRTCGIVNKLRLDQYLCSFAELQTFVVCNSRLPTAPMYDADTVCCLPRPCSSAMFQPRVYGSFKLGLKTNNCERLPVVGIGTGPF